MINLGNEIFSFNRGDRIAQIVFSKVEQVQLEEVEELDESDRGTGGYGSTGISKKFKTRRIK